MTLDRIIDKSRENYFEIAVKQQDAPLNLDGLPAGLYPAVLAAIQRDAGDEYDITFQDGAYLATNRAQGIHATFTHQGMEIHASTNAPDALCWGMQLTGIGRGDKLLPMPLTELVASGNRLEYRRGNLTEWYINGPLG